MKTLAVLLGISLLGAWALACADAAADGPGPVSAADPHPPTDRAGPVRDGSVLDVAAGLAGPAIRVVSEGYGRAPALVLAFSALLVLPLAAVISLIARRALREPAKLAPIAPEWTRRAPGRPGSPAWPAQAWLSVEGESAMAHPVAGELIRLGRHPDNEVWLSDTSVHRYHAIIHRTEDADFVITDLSGKEGNGVRVNGSRQTRIQLSDGDVIELGKARMTFASIPI